MYKFTYYLREDEHLRKIGEIALFYEDAVKYIAGDMHKSFTEERFEKGFVHSDAHPCTIKESDILRLRITKES